MRNTLLRRKELLERLGGLSEPKVENKEWLYLLGEETRNSISIEGYFVSEKELEEVLLKGRAETRDEKVAFNYFRTALFVYGLAYENYKTGEFYLSEALIRQINKGVTEGIGEYRKGDIVIAGAKLKPPRGHHVKDWMKLYINWTLKDIEKCDIVEIVSKQHILFESIHPFEDGNGRTGRILINYILISKGFPPVIIKGDREDRKKYIGALEAGEEPLRKLLTTIPDRLSLEKAMSDMNSKKLEELVENDLIRNMDRILIPLIEKKLNITLKSSSEVARELGYSPDSIRELIRRGHFIAIKKGKSWFTHPSLDLRKIHILLNEIKYC